MKKILCSFLCFVFLFNSIAFNFQIKNVFAEELYKSKNREIIIFIPGIMGTELYYDTERVWVPNTKSITSFFKSLASLVCDENGNPFMQDIEIGAPLTDYSDLLKEKIENTDKYEVLMFGYDWRLDNSINADRLKKFIDTNTDSDQKVSIIAHSMGGLITAKYIANGNSKKINKYISIGVPYLGAPKTLYMLETGNIEGFSSTTLSRTLNYQISNMRSLYQLLPTKQYFNKQNNYYINKNIITNTTSSKKAIKTSIKTFNESENFIIDRKISLYAKEHLKNAEDFYKSLEPVLFKGKYALNSVDSYFIIGNGQTGTIGKIEEQYEIKNAITKFKKCTVLSNTEGDGTVPLYSATIGGRTNPNKTFYVKEFHSELCNNEKVISQVLNILK
ncbi:hypothetical protein K9O30_16385 [Clostridium bowmanii]|uniref:lipase/acyltransferase domain-containing protein n=1 Tax=Clostridium bowmanii TaxID=132925 RepID=UPI001C0C67BC|nr:hypothetical protein [Clostridium bowmanii]MBU3190829.1 hypothetical protein [Clostridium bowmanii]MCA1075268.1 hypothetical protein [Clostridium bowmanii]